MPASAAALWPKVQSSLKALTSVRVAETGKAGGETTMQSSILSTLDGRDATGTMLAPRHAASNGGSTTASPSSTSESAKNTVSIVVVDGTRYAKYPRDVLLALGDTPQQGQELARRVGDHWVRLPASSDRDATMTTGLKFVTTMANNLNTASDAMRAPSSSLTHTTYSGAPAWLITTADHTMRAWIAADGTNHLLRFQNDEGGDFAASETYILDQFDAPVEVTAPHGAIAAPELTHSASPSS